MKIWILTSEIPTYNPGGIARYVDNFARGLGAQGHEVRVISRAYEAGEVQVAPGYHLHTFRTRDGRGGEPAPSPRPDEHPCFPYNILDYWTALSWQYADELAALAARLGPPDIIETQEYGAIGYYLIQRRLTEAHPLSAVPVVVNAHSPDFLLRGYNEEPRHQLPVWWHGEMEKSCLLAADAVIAPSAYLARQLEGLFAEQALRVRALHLPWTDVSHLAPVGRDPATVLYLGRLEVRKGVLRLLKACERLWNGGVDFRLDLAGGDTDYVPRGTTVRAFIENRYAHRIAEGRLRCLGPLPQAQLLPLVQRAQVVTIPSIWENWPNTCIEAMSLESVVVASVHGGMAEMIGDDRQAGFLFSWDEPGACEKQLCEALALDSQAHRAMGAEARRRVAALCDPARVLPQRLEHFTQVIRDFRPPTRFPFIDPGLRHSRAREALPVIQATPGLVSAVVPFFNLGATVEEAVDSILASDYPQLEVVIVDDGSTEPEAAAALQRLASRALPNCRIVRQANAGLASARNAGVDAARGEFVVFVDADDALEPGFIPQAVALLRRYENVEIVTAWERYFEASDDFFPKWNLEFPYLLAHNLTCPLCLVRRAAWLAHGRNKPKFAYNFEDYESWISMVAAGCGGIVIHAPLVRYRIRKNSLWQGSGRRQHLHLYELLAEEHPELYRRYGVELFALQNANGPAQEWIKPAAYSVYDRRLEWEREELARLQQLAHQHWLNGDEAWKRLNEADAELKRRAERIAELESELTRQREEAFRQWQSGATAWEKLEAADAELKRRAARIAELEASSKSQGPIIS